MAAKRRGKRKSKARKSSGESLLVEFLKLQVEDILSRPLPPWESFSKPMASYNLFGKFRGK